MALFKCVDEPLSWHSRRGTSLGNRSNAESGNVPSKMYIGMPHALQYAALPCSIAQGPTDHLRELLSSGLWLK